MAKRVLYAPFPVDLFLLVGGDCLHLHVNVKLAFTIKSDCYDVRKHHLPRHQLPRRSTRGLCSRLVDLCGVDSLLSFSAHEYPWLSRPVEPALSTDIWPPASSFACIFTFRLQV